MPRSDGRTTLVLKLKPNEHVTIDGGIMVCVRKSGRGSVTIAFIMPQNVRVHRKPRVGAGEDSSEGQSTSLGTPGAEVVGSSPTPRASSKSK